MPGVTDTTVTIGSTQPESGDAVPGYGEIAEASAAYFSFVNAHGGVHGRRIIYTHLDDGYQPAATSALTDQLLQQRHVFAVFNAFGTPTHAVVAKLLNREHVPDVMVDSACPCWNDVRRYPFTFGFQPNLIIEGKILGGYLKTVHPGQKVGYLVQNDFGAAAVRGLTQALPHSTIVSRQSYRLGTSDLSAQVAALQRSGAQVLVAFTMPAYTALLVLNLVKADYHPLLVVSESGSDPTTVGSLIGLLTSSVHKHVDPRALLSNIVTDGFLPPPTNTGNSWIRLFRHVHDEYLPTVPFDGNVVYGMAAAYTFVAALEATGRNLTRGRLRVALERGLSPGPGLAPLGYSPTSHDGYVGVRVGIITRGVLKYFGPVLVTDESAKRIVEYRAGKQASAPANGLPPPS